MSDIQQHPKFVMQVNRQQPVPKLVSINDFSSAMPNIPTQSVKKDKNMRPGARDKSADKVSKSFSNNFYDSRQDNSSLQQSNQYQSYYPGKSQMNFTANNFTSSNGQNTSIPQNNPSNPTSTFYTTARKQLPVTQPRNYRLQVIQLQKLLQIQKQQKLQLQQIIKQLTVNSQKLKQVNEHIVDRLKQLQKSFVQEKIQQQKQQQERVRKAIYQVYEDVQNYVRGQIQSLTNKLKGQRMTPLLQKKLQIFMESMLQINQRTVQMSKISKRKNSTGINVLQQFLSGRNNQKENLTASNMHFNRLSLIDDNRLSNNNTYISKSSHRRQSLSPRSGRRLINNAYITSNKKQNPSKVLFQTNTKNDSYPHQYSTILKQLQNNHSSYRQQYTRESPEQISNQHVQFLNPFNTNSFQTRNKNRRNDKMSESFIERKKYYQTSNYDQKNFHVKEYTPNKRKKIFDKDQRSRSKSRYYNTRNE